MGEIKKCTCGGTLTNAVVERSGIELKGLKCRKCKEIYFPSSEMMKYEILTGKSSLVRKVRKSGDSMIVTVPKQIIEKFDVHEDDMIYFESENDKNIVLKILHPHGE
jgi:hypothetical protein